MARLDQDFVHGECSGDFEFMRGGHGESHTVTTGNYGMMPLNSSTVHSLRRVFEQAFTVHDIAEPLVSFDDSTPAQNVCEAMKRRRFDIAGIRRDGQIAGYIEVSDLTGGVCGDFIRPFRPEHVVLESTSLAALITGLKEQRRLFVSLLGQVGGIVSRTDLQKPPVRMWLFGMVTLIEMRFSRMIEQFCQDTWKEFLSHGRILKAEELLAERIRRNQDLELLDCLQLSDKVQIIARNETLRAMTRFPSRRKLEDAVKVLEKLRNNLAHAQDIISNDWDAIVLLSERLDAVLEGPPGLADGEHPATIATDGE